MTIKEIIDDIEIEIAQLNKVIKNNGRTLLLDYGTMEIVVIEKQLQFLTKILRKLRDI